MTVLRASSPRLLALAFAALGLVWGVQMLPTLWQARGIERTADLILQGHRFATRDLIAAAARADAQGPSPYARVRRSVAVLKLRLVEEAVATGDRQSLDRRLVDLRRSIIELFAIDPSDSFFWMMYYWCNMQTDGFAPSQLKFLEFSYDVGPNEGWIATRRNRLALSVFVDLSPAMSDRVLSEFAGLVSSGFIVDAASNLLGPGAVVKAQLLQRLADVPIAERELLARYLRGINVDLAVPGVNLPGKRFY